MPLKGPSTESYGVNMIGPKFADEVRAAGLGGLTFSWSPDGTIFGRESLTPEQDATLDAVLAAHDPEAQSTDVKLTPRQLRLALLSTGTTESGVDALIDAIPDTEEKEWARIEWKHATSFERDHPLIDSIGTALGYTDSTQIDTLWTWASAL
jgi:hypothetical protein